MTIILAVAIPGGVVLIAGIAIFVAVMMRRKKRTHKHHHDTELEIYGN